MIDDEISTNAMSKPRHSLFDEKWALIAPHIPARKGRPNGDARLFLDAILWVGITGAPWRDLPSFFGNWNHVYQRFSYWCNKGHFEAIFNALQQPDMEEIMIDPTSCKAHQASAGAEKKRSPVDWRLSVSRGGLNTKIHAVCDALGNPLRFKLTPDNFSDVGQLPALIEGLAARHFSPTRAMTPTRSLNWHSLPAWRQSFHLGAIGSSPVG